MKASEEWNSELNHNSRKNYEKQSKKIKIKQHEEYEVVIG